MCGGDDLLAWLPHHVRNDQTRAYTLTLYFLTLPVCSLRFFLQSNISLVFQVCVSVSWCWEGGGGAGVWVIFLSDGGERVWSNVKIITSGGREIERKD